MRGIALAELYDARRDGIAGIRCKNGFPAHIAPRYWDLETAGSCTGVPLDDKTVADSTEDAT